ncbi:MAG TPA: hypothetical protein VFO62_05430, partial [Candidatus Binatia bacterium]|nr:hypothetical protein [Candidatus Binatia bacterium]
MSTSFRLPRLYPIVDVRDESSDAIERALRLAVELAAAGAMLLQLRAKLLAAGAMTALATPMVAAVETHGAR